MSVIKWWLTDHSRAVSELASEYKPHPTDAVPFYQIYKLWHLP